MDRLWAPYICRNGKAFGVDTRRPHTYSLRQARYFEIALTVRDWFPEAFEPGGQRLRNSIKLLDIGCQNGVTRKYLDLVDVHGAISYTGADLFLNPELENPDDWDLVMGDFQEGYPELPDAGFDVVICEQVIEHLPSYETAMATLSRVLKPGGLAIIGVPIFPDGLHLVRRHVVPMLDRLTRRKKQRGHVQAFSQRHFISELKRFSDLEIITARGFRIMSGGVLRPLENSEWFWQMNRRIGRHLSSLCIEIQVLATKSAGRKFRE